MSVKVTKDELRDQLDRFGPAAFLVTTGDDSRPHTTHVVVRGDADRLSCAVGTKTARNIAARPAVVLLFPPVEAGGFSLIVDADATADAEAGVAHLTPGRVVLHRNAVAGDGGYEADCVRLDP
jgi:hypothetical protein